MAGDIIEGVHPTRSDLLEMQRTLKLSKKGHKLLEEKRDALVMEFFEKIKELKDLRRELIEEMAVGYKAMIRAETLVGPAAVDSISRSAPKSLDLKIEAGNIMGVRIPKFTLKPVSEDTSSIGSLSMESSSIDEAAATWAKVVKKLLIVVEAEETLKRLAEEIKKTKRRVNSLEYRTIPRLVSTRKYIRSRLEEQERESFFRLKTIKKKSKKKQAS